MTSTPFRLTDDQMERLKPFFPKSHGKPSVVDRPVPGGMIFFDRNGSRWCDAPREHGPYATTGTSGEAASHTPTKVTASPANITTVNGSPNIAQAQIIVTGGLR